MFEIGESARKHGYTGQEISFAVMHYGGMEPIVDRYGRPAQVFVGPPHEGALKNDWIEVMVRLGQNGDFRCFHAMHVSDMYSHLIPRD
ncbi:hypothetical protein CRD60_04505 [Bifidobacterium aemilianum]|uniref:Uncharacterized protein n=1 Tax=Bifidobacterium aemilianum TaxID=2493120 RepID=A0A366K9D2_9BIFI|nr:hypothetical protein CRD60_04505 [Bifidobacterium aemilianum]